MSPTTASTTTRLVTLDDLRRAAERLRGVARQTPLLEVEFPEIPQAAGSRRFYLKAESLQPIGSFKLRGAYNKAVSLTVAERSRGLIAYSSGNHGQGVAYAARALGTRAIIVMPSNAPTIKRRAAEALGAEIVVVGPASMDRKVKAEELAALHGYTIIPPYDDPEIIAGQGTCGLEILAELPDVDLVLVPVGGGGLVSGIAAAIKLQRPEVQVWGVEPEMASDAAESLAQGSIVRYSAEQTSRTLADGLRTQQVGDCNFPHMRAFVDGIVRVSENEIVQAMRATLFTAHLVAEPSGAVAPAAMLFHAQQFPKAKKICAILSGGNVEPEILTQVLTTELAAR
jgi:threonine dehydratase